MYVRTYVCMYVCGEYQAIESLKITTLGFKVCMYVVGCVYSVAETLLNVSLECFPWEIARPYQVSGR